MKVKKKTGPKIQRCSLCRRKEGEDNQGELTAFYDHGSYCKVCNREVAKRNYRRRVMAAGGEVTPRPPARPAESEGQRRREIDTLMLRVIERLLHYGPRRAAEILPGIEAALPKEGKAELADLKRAIAVIGAVKGRVMREESF